jgi:hypothetical protein
MFEKFMNAFMVVFMIVGTAMLILVLGGAVYQVAYPAEVIQRRDKACYEGCQTSQDPQFCYKACLMERD